MRRSHPCLPLRLFHKQKIITGGTCSRGSTCQTNEWKSKNTNDNLLIYSLGLISGHRNRDQHEVYQAVRCCLKSWRHQTSGTARRTQVLTKYKCTGMLKSLFARALQKHQAWGTCSEQATLGQPVKNSALTSNWQWFCDRKYWANPTVGSTARPLLLSLPVTYHQKRNRNIVAPISVFGPHPLSTRAHIRTATAGRLPHRDLESSRIALTEWKAAIARQPPLLHASTCFLHSHF